MVAWSRVAASGGVTQHPRQHQLLQEIQRSITIKCCVATKSYITEPVKPSVPPSIMWVETMVSPAVLMREKYIFLAGSVQQQLEMGNRICTLICFVSILVRFFAIIV
jgi:hypothetical protein